MRLVKPNKTETTIITITLSIAFGMVLGVLSMSEKIKDIEFEHRLLMLHAEEVMEMNEQLMLMNERGSLER